MWAYNYTYQSDELYHYGVPGMRWGQRKSNYSSSYNNLRTAKSNKRRANHQYSKSFNKAYYIGTKKNWKKAAEDAHHANKAKAQYKTAKKKYKQEVNKNYSKIDRQTTMRDRYMYNDATRKKAAKYMTKYKNMSVAEATKKAKGNAWKNTAIFMAAAGGLAAAKYVANNLTPYTVTDATGKVLKRGLQRLT